MNRPRIFDIYTNVHDFVFGDMYSYYQNNEDYLTLAYQIDWKFVANCIFNIYGNSCLSKTYSYDIFFEIIKSVITEICYYLDYSSKNYDVYTSFLQILEDYY